MQPREALPEPTMAPPITEESARLMAERMAFAANALPALIAYLDTGPRYVWVNEGYSRWFGLPREAILGRQPPEVLGASAWAAVRPYAERALAGEEVAFDNTVVKDGETRVVRASYVPHRDDAGRVRGFVALVTDISETKAVESALRLSERMLEQSQATAQVGSWEVTLDEGLWEVPGTSLWSRETYRLFGYEPGTPASLSLFYRRVHPDDRAALQSRSALAIGRGEPLETEYRIVRPDGGERVIHAWLHFERAADGKTYAFGTCQDITERKRADLEIRQAREHLQVVVDATPALIARYDSSLRVVWANGHYAARFGKKPEDLVGMHLRDIVGAPAFAPIEPATARVLAGEEVDVEIEIPYPTLGRRSMHFVVSPTRDGTGAVDGCVAVITDNTRHREVERERERALAELQEVDRRKDEFLAMLSHELRNPMAPILSAVEILRLSPADAKGAIAARDVIERQVLHMKRLLDDLLDVSRVSGGKISLQWEAVDLGAVILQAVEVSRPLLAEKRQRFSFNSGGSPTLVHADSARLVQVFGNLLNNASKYSEPGGPIDVALSVEGDQAVVKVRDQGVGMTPELLEHAFDLFVQDVRSLDRAQGGIGIGLTLVRSLVKLHGGSVQAFSDGPGRGCEIVVRLPRAGAGARVETAARAAGPDRRLPLAPASRPLRILVVDDNVDAASTLTGLLALLGHEVAVAHDGPAALTTATKTRPDIVFIDIGLPGMDGYALATALRGDGFGRTKLVAITGYGRADDEQRSRACGFDQHLVKPVDVATLERITSSFGGA